MERGFRLELNQRELELAAELKERGLENGETNAKLADWLDEQERIAHNRKVSGANIVVNLRRALLYKAAGYLDHAWETLNEVRDQAHAEGDPELREAAERIMDEIDSENGPR